MQAIKVNFCASGLQQICNIHWFTEFTVNCFIITDKCKPDAIQVDRWQTDSLLFYDHPDAPKYLGRQQLQVFADQNQSNNFKGNKIKTSFHTVAVILALLQFPIFFPLVTMALHNKMMLYVPGEPELLEKGFMVRRDKDWAHNDSVPAVKHGGGSIMHCGCCVACGTDTLHTLDGIVKEDYFQIPPLDLKSPADWNLDTIGSVSSRTRITSIHQNWL